ncbi:MAG: PGPGW domain-containing protein [Ancrocorticia sp.]|uniref:TIGR02611 family protein n=1 Tax=Ancrocorticia populi TaxID=2175228 RepID=A0A2V1KBQ1_9ACTO|nr:PGPGW domain-containing protein [Ancrocorticia sp.]PWF26380.1 hypothetical protein DD236_05835 [Ancrocorticia populi]
MSVAIIWKNSRRLVIGLIGGGVVVLGVILMPLPGPGTLIVLGGFAILATEFEGAARVKEWGFRQLDRCKEFIRRHRGQ